MAFLFSLILAQAPTPTPPWWPTWTAEMTAYWGNVFGTATASSPGAADTAEAHAWASQAAHARGTAWGWPSVTATPTTEPTPTVPTATATPKPAPSGPTPTLAPRPSRTAFTVTARPTATHPTRTATATGTPTAGERRYSVALPLLLRKRMGIRTVAADAAGR